MAIYLDFQLSSDFLNQGEDLCIFTVIKHVSHFFDFFVEDTPLGQQQAQVLELLQDEVINQVASVVERDQLPR